MYETAFNGTGWGEMTRRDRDMINGMYEYDIYEGIYYDGGWTLLTWAGLVLRRSGRMMFRGDVSIYRVF